ncbi:MAG: hypothetical protein CL431_01995 [Acidimicrobiaceae bacterium]|nr:hypothetical protein [Acidimicrobiaceae bacterium]
MEVTPSNIEDVGTAVEEPDTTVEEEPVLLSPADIGEQLGDAVWEVVTDACGIESGGSSFAVARDIFITNEHVIGPDMTPTLISRNGDTLEGIVIGKDKELDVAVVRVSTPVDLWLEWADPNALREGEPVVSLGYPAPYYSFSVSPGTIISFLREGSSRIGVISDEASDYGSSGGPLISATGQVVGVVTQYVKEGGAQLNGESFTYSHLGSFIERSIQDGTATTENCDGYAYGTNIIGDYLWDLCSDGTYWACDNLFNLDLYVPVGGEYTEFGATCGDRVEIDIYCIEYFKTSFPTSYGEDPNLDILYDECSQDNGNSCDLLYFASSGFEDDDYFQFAATCGNTEEFDTVWCGWYVADLVNP